MATLLALIKEWIPFVFLGVGGILAVFGYFQQKSRRNAKTSMVLMNFKNSTHAHDLAHWKEIYLGTSEFVSVSPGYFVDQTGQTVPLDSMWTAGSDDHTAIQRMAENFEKICAEILKETLDTKAVWYEVGQLMTAVHRWLGEIQGVSEELTFLEEQYPSIKAVFEKHAHDFKRWPHRLYIQE